MRGSKKFHPQHLFTAASSKQLLLAAIFFSMFVVWGWQNNAKYKDRTVAISQDGVALLKDLLGAKGVDRAQYLDAIASARLSLPAMRSKDSLALWLEANRLIAKAFDLELEDRKASLKQIDNALSELSKWRSPKTESEKYMLALLFLREVTSARDDGDLKRLKEALERTEKIFRSEFWGKDKDIAFFFFQQLANLHVRLGDYTAAVNCFKESIAYERTFRQDGITSYNDYGNIYLALDDYEAALQIFEDGLLTPQGNYDSTFLFLNKSEALVWLGRLDEAIAWNKKAYERLEKRGGLSSEDMAKCEVGYLENEAFIKEKQQKWGEARQFYTQIFEDSVRVKMLNRRDHAGYYAAIANTYLQENNPTTALSYYHKAYLKYYPNAGDDPKVLPNAGELPGDKVLIHILEGKAQSWAMLQQYADALKAYECIPEIEAQLRATHSFEKSTLLALEQSRQRFDRVVGLAWEAWEKTKDPAFAATAFHFTEQARGVLQTKGLHANEASALLEADQQQADKALANEIAIVQNQLDNADEAALDTLMVNMRALKQQQQKIRGEWAKSNPAYAAAIGENKVLAATAVGKLLRKGQTLLDYYFGQDQQLYLFAFDADGNAAWARRAWAQDAQVATDTLLQLISRNPAEGDASLFAKHALVLGQHLLAAPDAVFLGQKSPVLDTCLLVIPDLELAALPFDLLLTQPATGNDWSAMPYALRQYRIGYGYSVSLLGMQQAITQKRSGKARVPFVGFAPDYHDGTPPLEKADDDVRFGAQLFNGQPLVGPEATEAQYRELAEQAQILLLSMHGISNHERPGLSCLRMGDTIKTGPYDNVLHANELQAIPCRADLAVMSACFTGDGPVKVGEGVYSMARSFAIAGVPATTMSLWKFPVKSSSALVCDFLTGIHQKMSKEVALHRAKVNWLAQNQGTKFAHPYFWAGMVAAGDMSPLQTNSNQWWYLAAALGALLLAGAWWLMRR